MPTTHSYVATWNKYPDNYKKSITDMRKTGLITWWASSEEIAPKTGTPHLQVAFQSYKDWHAMQKQLVKSLGYKIKRIGAEDDKQKGTNRYIWFSKQMGNDEQVIDYLKKVDKGLNQEIWTIGNHIGTALNYEQCLRKFYDNPKYSMKEFARSHPYEHRTFHKEIQANLDAPPARPDQMPDKRSTWLHGVPGSGKTTDILTAFPNAYVFKPTRNTPYFPDYRGQEVVIIEDVEPDQLRRSEWLGLLGQDPYTVELGFGGRKTWLMAKKVFVTSNFTPEDVFYDHKDGGKAALRRIHLRAIYEVPIQDSEAKEFNKNRLKPAEPVQGGVNITPPRAKSDGIMNPAENMEMPDIIHDSDSPF